MAAYFHLFCFLCQMLWYVSDDWENIILQIHKNFSKKYEIQ